MPPQLSSKVDWEGRDLYGHAPIPVLPAASAVPVRAGQTAWLAPTRQGNTLNL
jgi:hypothetical protein